MRGSATYDAEITELRPDDLELLELCPASRGWSSELPRWPLFRWAAIRDSFRTLASEGTWDDEAVARAIAHNTSGFDSLQREICAGAVRTFLRMLPPKEGEEVDWWPDGLSVEHPEQAWALTSWPTFVVRTPAGTEVGKLRSGRRGTSGAEAAVLLEALEDDVDAYDAMVAAGVIEPIELHPDERREEIARLFSIWEAYEGNPDRRPRPGAHCHLCDRPANCGAYRGLDGHAARARHRAIKVSKGSLGWLDVSERRVAWKHLHGIPSDEVQEGADDLDELADPRSRGLEAHQMLARVLVAEDPERELKDHLVALSPSERKDLEMYWAHHQEAEEEHTGPVSYKETEYTLGTTLIVPGHPGESGGDQAEVAVVLIGTADAVGREEDRTPAVVDHKTGRVGEGSQYERDLYAVGAAVRLGRFEGGTRVAVHIHRLAPDEQPRCERGFYNEEGLQEAWSRLRQAARRIASWDPNNSLSVECQQPDRCRWCPFEGLCARVRNGTPVRDF